MMLRQRISLFNYAYRFCTVTETQKVDPFSQLKDHVLNYTYKEAINLPNQNISFEKDMSPALEIYKNLGYNKNHLSRLWKMNPSSLLISTDENQNDILKLSKFLMEKLSMNGREIKTMMFKHPKILKYTNEQLGKFIQTFREDLQMTDEQIKRLLFFYPRVIEGDFRLKVHETRLILNNYASMEDKQIGEFCSRFPYLLEVDKRYMEKNIKILINIGLRPIEIQKMLDSTCEFLSLNPPYFYVTIQTYLSLIPDKKILRELLMKHPRLLLLCPYTMVVPKINIFKDNGLDHEQIGQILQVYPQIFLKSVGSLKLKLQYLKRFYKHKPLEDPFFPKILTHKYWDEIRPRGELLRVKDTKFDWQEVLELSQQDFIKKFNIPEEAIQKLLDEKPNKFEEIDYKKKFFTKYFKNSGRYVKE